MTDRHRHRHRHAARKLLLYSHDTYGLGHLRRNLRVARHLLELDSKLQIVLVSGSTVSERFLLPKGLTLIKLPPVRKVGAERYQPLDPQLGIGLIRRARTAIMSDVVRRLRPDVLLVDHSPAGMHGELLGVFDTVRTYCPETRIVLGLRDILDAPDAVVRNFADQDLYRIIADAYDQVLVYGSRDVFDVGTSYQLPEDVRNRLVYCGYLRPAPSSEAARGETPLIDSPYLLATAGGGGDGGVVLAGAIEAGRLLGTHTLAVAGPLMGDADYAALEAMAAGVGSLQLVRFHPQLQAAMAGAAAIVTMGGYNSLSEAVATDVSTVVVPRREPRLEQTIRAQLFAQRGLVRVVELGPGLGSRIAAAVRAGRNDRRVALDFNGLDTLAQTLLSPVTAPRHGAFGNGKAEGDEDLSERLLA